MIVPSFVPPLERSFVEIIEEMLAEAVDENGDIIDVELERYEKEIEKKCSENTKNQNQTKNQTSSHHNHS
jgi:hypothetical protein